MDDIAPLTTAQPDWFRRAFDVSRSSGTVEVEGAAIRYYRWGNPDAPGVLLTHGFMAHARCWAFIAPLLAERFCLVAFDLSGMGDSGWRERYDMQIRARECLAVAEHAGLVRPHLVCHSFGGGVGLTAAMAHPEAFRSLVICDMSMLAPGEPSQFEERMSARKERGIRPHRVMDDFDAVRARFRLAPDQPCANEYLMEYMARHSIRPTESGYIWKFDPRIMGADEERGPDWWTSIAPNFAGLTLPRAAVYGEYSMMMSARVRDFLTSREIPLVRVADAHHHIMLDQPLALASALEALLQTLGNRG